MAGDQFCADAPTQVGGVEPTRHDEPAREGCREIVTIKSLGPSSLAGGFNLKESVLSEEEPIYPPATKELAEQRKVLAPQNADAFKAFSRSVFAEGALPAKTKQLIAVAVAHVTQCPYCIRGHTKSALQHGSTPQEIMEAIWVAAEMRAGAAYAHSILALDTIAHGTAHQ